METKNKQPVSCKTTRGLTSFCIESEINGTIVAISCFIR